MLGPVCMSSDVAPVFVTYSWGDKTKSSWGCSKDKQGGCTHIKRARALMASINETDTHKSEAEEAREEDNDQMQAARERGRHIILNARRRSLTSSSEQIESERSRR